VPVDKVAGSTGWANFSGIPAATAVVTGRAVGYYSNSSTLELQYSLSGNTWTLYLTPLPPGAYSGVRILPPGVASLWALALVPVAAVFGVLVYLTMLRTPSLRERDAERSSARARKPAPPP
jgi:hypothetical protein